MSTDSIVFKIHGIIMLLYLDITPLKFESVWILHLEVLEFEFYLLKFGGVWILYPEVSEFGFYLLKFGVFRFYTLTF